MKEEFDGFRNRVLAEPADLDGNGEISYDNVQIVLDNVNAPGDNIAD